MNKTKHNQQTERLNCAERLMYLNEIAATKAACEAELRAKDEYIEYYKKAAEQATRSKHRALERRDEHRKDMIVLALLIVGIAAALWIGGLAVHEMILWAQGR